MKVKDLIKELQKYNPEASVCIIQDNTSYNEITISCGYSDGCTMDNCEEVNLSPGTIFSFDENIEKASKLIYEEAKHYKPNPAKEFIDKVNRGELPPLSESSNNPMFGLQTLK